MRFLVNISLPHEPFNRLIREGVAGARLGRVVEETRPEHIVFLEQAGRRAAVALYEVPDATRMCAIAEPWFLTFEAECTFHLAMTPEDLARAGMDELGRRWA